MTQINFSYYISHQIYGKTRLTWVILTPGCSIPVVEFRFGDDDNIMSTLKAM